LGTKIQKYEEEEFFSRTNELGQEFMGEGMVIPFEQQFDLFKRTGPFTVHNRYITEDIPVGCCIQRDLALSLGIETPIIEAMINLASIMTKEDYNATGWGLDTLGIAELSKEQLLDYLHTGAI
jgi:opine dehydrogenase